MQHSSTRWWFTVTEVTFRSDIGVELIDFMGSDQSVVRSARVSTLGAASVESQESQGLINFLWREGHHSPFEHNAFTFMVEAPIFTINQLVRHRIASYNVESGRYKELAPVFYVPSKVRPVVQVGKTGDYEFEEADPDSRISSVVRGTIYGSSEDAWESYEFLLSQGVAKEVARMVLPLNIYSSLYVTMNARALMNFLRLRNDSHAQWEIREMAQRMEVIFAENMPMTYRAFRGIR